MTTSHVDDQLVRANVSNWFEVDECNIKIVVNSNLKEADYVYRYIITKKSEAPDEWREVFDYPPREVKIYYAKECSDGRLLQVPPPKQLDSTTQKSLVRIEFGRTLAIGEKFEFEYKCSTQIEALPPLSSLVGLGSVWFWCAHEFFCRLVRVEFSLPNRVKPIQTQPPLHDIKTQPLVFKREALRPGEFSMSLINYEKSFFGMKPRVVQVLVWLSAIVLSVVVKYFVDSFFKIFTKQ